MNFLKGVLFNQSKNVDVNGYEKIQNRINEKNNYLPPDNYQDDRAPKTVARTSSTNIGLGMLSVISSYDMKF